MNFKPSKWKTIVTILIILIWYVLLILLANMTYCRYICPDFNSNDCPKNFVIDLYPQPCDNVCSCPKNNINDIISDIIIIFFPGILIYILWSFIEKKK